MLLLRLFKNERLKKKSKKKKQYLKLLSPSVRGSSALPFFVFKKLHFCCSQTHEIALTPRPWNITLTFRHHLQRCSNHNQNSQIQRSQILLEPTVVIALWHIPIFIVCCAGVVEMMWILLSLIGRNSLRSARGRVLNRADLALLIALLSYIFYNLHYVQRYWVMKGKWLLDNR